MSLSVIDVDLRLHLGSQRFAFALRTTARAIGLSGPSGSGKSTFLRCLAGLEREAEGHLWVLGARWQDGRAFVMPWERGVGWVPQDALLFPHLDVRQNLAFAARDPSEIVPVAERLGLAALLDRPARNLSGGERQRVALGRALLSRPRLLLLDEPFAALDKPLRARLAADVSQLCRARDLPVVVVSHDEADLVALCDARWELRGGALLELADERGGIGLGEDSAG